MTVCAAIRASVHHGCLLYSGLIMYLNIMLLCHRPFVAFGTMNLFVTVTGVLSVDVMVDISTSCS